jgi:hypothetical protein
MNIQPGAGYGFNSSGYGISLDTSEPFKETTAETYQQFQCIVVKEGDDYFLKTYKGVVDFSKSQFPFSPGGSSPSSSGGPTMFSWTEKQARITDWAVYRNGTRTAGTATDGPAFNWFAGDGKVEIINGDYEGGSNTWLVTISMIDWYDLDGVHAADRLIDAEMPFVSVFPADDTEMTDRIQAPTYSSISARNLYIDESTVDDGSSVPQRIGYTYKKIAQIDWDSDTNSWIVTQYEYGPIDLRINWTETIGLASGAAPDPSDFENAAAADFDNVSNYAWFESLAAIPGYTQNPAAWWYNLVT